MEMSAPAISPTSLAKMAPISMTLYAFASYLYKMFILQFLTSFRYKPLQPNTLLPPWA